MEETPREAPPSPITTFPYPVVKGIPTYDTDYAQLGAKALSMGDILGIVSFCFCEKQRMSNFFLSQREELPPSVLHQQE